MSLRLEALSATDGTGIIRSEHTLRLLRPPDILQDSPVLREESIEDAILRYGFSASREQFVTWEEAIDYLNRQAVVSLLGTGQTNPQSIASADIITPPGNVYRTQ